MSGIDAFREKLQVLVSKFEKDKHHYLSKGYPEAQVRIDFLNPLFEALGWDIENKAQKPPHEGDVIVELSPETSGRPDCNFRISGATKFFIEAKAPSVALDEYYFVGSGGGGGYGISLPPDSKFSYSYLVGLLNSALLSSYLRNVSTPFRGGYIALNRQYIEQLPIRTIDFKNPSEKAAHDKLVTLVDSMLELHKKENVLPPSAEREKIEREITITDEKIDEIIYGLYGVTDEERKIIESA